MVEVIGAHRAGHVIQPERKRRAQLSAYARRVSSSVDPSTTDALRWVFRLTCASDRDDRSGP